MSVDINRRRKDWNDHQSAKVVATMNSRSPHYAAAQFVCQRWFPTKEGCLLQAVASIDAFLGPLSPRKALNAACQAGALEATLEYFLSRTTPNWNEVVRAAVQGGHLHVLRWMTSRRDGRWPWKTDFDHLLEVAASHGHLEVVKWLFERGTDWYTVWTLDKSTQGYYAKTWSYELNVSKGLQVAAANGHFAVVQWLHGARSDTASRHGSPLSRAVANGHLDIAQWLHNAHGDECSALAVIEAAKNGHLEVLKWLHSNNLLSCTPDAMDRAAENGHLEVVKWLHRVHHESCSPRALFQAVNSGRLELVEWLYANVYLNCQRYVPYMSGITAAEHGHLQVVTWVHEHFPNSFSNHEMDAAARNGHMHVITWLHENRSEGCSAMASCDAADNGHLETVQWLHTHYPSVFVPQTMDGAAANGYLEVVQWLHENRPEGCTEYAMYFAATKDHLDVFLYLLEHRTEGFPSSTKQDAQDIHVLCQFGPDIRGNRRPNRVTGAQLKILQTVFEQRPAYLQDCLRCLAWIACSSGNIAMLDWVNQFGIQLRSTTPIRSAIGGGDVKLLRWFSENGFVVMGPDLLEFAVERGQLDAASWLSEHGHTVNSLELVKVAGKNRNVPLLRWLVEHGPPLDLSTARTLVLEQRHIEIAWWVSEENRRHIVLQALQKDDRNVLWWVLSHTSFRNEITRQTIRDAIQRSPEAAKQWFGENMRGVEACRWCFSRSSKRQNEEIEETSFFSMKHQKTDR